MSLVERLIGNSLRYRASVLFQVRTDFVPEAGIDAACSSGALSRHDAGAALPDQTA
jgi:hypothetical protein